MQRPAALFCVVVLPLLVTAAYADSNPYISTEPSGVSSPAAAAAAANCQTKLDNNAYDCNVKSSFSTTFTSCYQFISPGTVSSAFDLAVSGLSGSNLGCSCNPTGSFKKPKFNGSPETFDCVGTNGFQFTGKVSGKKINGSGSTSVGDSFLFTCTVRSTAC
jgi:hypothetical protein